MTSDEPIFENEPFFENESHDFSAAAAEAAETGAFVKIRYKKPGEPATTRLIFAGKYNAEKQTLAAVQIHPDPGERDRRKFSINHVTDFKVISTEFPTSGKDGRCELLEDLESERLHFLRDALKDEIDEYKTDWILQMPGNPDYILDMERFAYAYSLGHVAGDANIGIETKGELRELIKILEIDPAKVEFVKARDWAYDRLSQVESLLGIEPADRTKIPRRKKTTKTATPRKTASLKRTAPQKAKSSGCLFIVTVIVVTLWSIL